MLDQYFDSDSNENQTAEHFYFIFEKVTEFPAYIHTDIRKHEGYKAYNNDRCDDI